MGKERLPWVPEFRVEDGMVKAKSIHGYDGELTTFIPHGLDTVWDVADDSWLIGDLVDAIPIKSKQSAVHFASQLAAVTVGEVMGLST